MSIALALLAALGLGASDFFAGLASRRIDFRLVSATVQSLGLLAALLAVLFDAGDGLTGRVVLWGAIAGIGTAIGAMLLYHGLATGRMSIVAALSGLMGSVVPVLFGLLQGDSLSTMSAVGVAIAIPAIVLVSWRPSGGVDAAASGAIWGFLAGLGFALFFIALDQAGTESGAWPIAVNQAVALLIAGALAAQVSLAHGVHVGRSGVTLTLLAGLGLGVAAIALQTALNTGELAIVVVLTSLYPGVTTLLARFTLAEHWVATQRVGLITALVAVVLVSVGSG